MRNAISSNERPTVPPVPGRVLDEDRAVRHSLGRGVGLLERTLERVGDLADHVVEAGAHVRAHVQARGRDAPMPRATERLWVRHTTDFS